MTLNRDTLSTRHSRHKRHACACLDTPIGIALSPSRHNVPAVNKRSGIQDSRELQPKAHKTNAPQKNRDACHWHPSRRFAPSLAARHAVPPAPSPAPQPCAARLWRSVPPAPFSASMLSPRLVQTCHWHLCIRRCSPTPNEVRFGVARCVNVGTKRFVELFCATFASILAGANPLPPRSRKLPHNPVVWVLPGSLTEAPYGHCRADSVNPSTHRKERHL
jgi:hypothetical protein